jgi:hypothetical protein
MDHQNLKPPDSLRLRAAQDWLEPGDHIEANVDLDNISAEPRVPHGLVDDLALKTVFEFLILTMRT